MNDRVVRVVGTLCAALVVSVAPGARDARAAVAPRSDTVAQRAVGHPDLFIRDVHLPVESLPKAVAARLGADLRALGVARGSGYYDVRSGRWGSLVLATPLVPGPGLGNTLTWSGLGVAAPAGDAAYKAAVWQAFTAYLDANAALLDIDAAALAAPSIGTYEGNRLVHVYAERVHDGIPVRDSFVRATLNSGNLVLYAARGWGAIDVPTRATVDAEAALARGGRTPCRLRRPRAWRRRARHRSRSPAVRRRIRPPSAAATTTAWPGRSRSGWRAAARPGRPSWTPTPPSCSRSTTATPTSTRRRWWAGSSP